MKWLSLIVAMGLIVGLSGCKGEQQTSQGPGGKKLTMTAPADTTIKPGGKTDVTVSIKRTAFDGPVDVSISDLPKGVNVDKDKKTIAKGESSATFSLTADGDAKEDEKQVTLLGKAAEVNDNKEHFKVKIKK